LRLQIETSKEHAVTNCDRMPLGILHLVIYSFSSTLQLYFSCSLQLWLLLNQKLVMETITNRFNTLIKWQKLKS
jgi:hypothetical protein